MADTLVLGTSAFGRESSSLSSPTNKLACGGYGQLVAQQSRKLPHRKGTGVRISYPPPNFEPGCSWESSLLPNQAYGVRILIPAPRRARQMASQHTANVPSVHARLGSIPRLSAKLVSKTVRVSGGYGWPRLPVEQSAPSERPGSNPGTPTTKAP